jgi:hypothetical protein
VVTDVDWIVQMMRIFSFLMPCPVKLFQPLEGPQRKPGSPPPVERIRAQTAVFHGKCWKGNEMNRTAEKLRDIGQSL